MLTHVHQSFHLSKLNNKKLAIYDGQISTESEKFKVNKNKNKKNRNEINLDKTNS
jgi:hypothetical protein